jgi:hypothetical protein
MQQPLSRARPERTAWVVVWSAFAVFCLLVVFVPLAVRNTLLYGTKARSATLTVLEGTVRVANSSGRLDALTKNQKASIEEGSVIKLDDYSSADLSFFDGSSVHLRPGCDVTVERCQSPRFGMGVRPNTIWLRVDLGRVRVVTSGPSRRTGQDFRIKLPYLGAEMVVKGDGTFGAEVQTDVADMFASTGSAIVGANGKSVQIIAPERTTVERGGQPSAPIATGRELVLNGDFRLPLPGGWRMDNDQGGDGGDINGQWFWTTEDGSPAVRFYRTGNTQDHCETYIEQVINRDLPDPVTSLTVGATVKLLNQSLSGGGSQASEYPLMIRIKYRDQYGSENQWVHGFYYTKKDTDPTANGEQIPKDTWWPYESENLLATLDPKPVTILSVRVYASGWDYDSLIRRISVTVQ